MCWVVDGFECGECDFVVMESWCICVWFFVCCGRKCVVIGWLWYVCLIL